MNNLPNINHSLVFSSDISSLPSLFPASEEVFQLEFDNFEYEDEFAQSNEEQDLKDEEDSLVSHSFGYSPCKDSSKSSINCSSSQIENSSNHYPASDLLNRNNNYKFYSAYNNYLLIVINNIVTILHKEKQKFLSNSKPKYSILHELEFDNNIEQVAWANKNDQEDTEVCLEESNGKSRDIFVILSDSNGFLHLLSLQSGTILFSKKVLFGNFLIIFSINFNF